MATREHLQHYLSGMAHSNCRECNADRERRFARIYPFEYKMVHEYLVWALPRIMAIRNGENSVNARIWQRDFIRALHNRINSKGFAGQHGRKYANAYLERMDGMRHVYDVEYLRRFAGSGASCL